MNTYSDLNPFNHGTATIKYEHASDVESSRLAAILREGWGIDDAKFLRLSAGAEKNSNNFRVETSSGVYLFKQSHINKPRTQDVISNAMSYLKDNSIKTPAIIPTNEGANHYVAKEGIFCFYDFIEGENFDGSQAELKNVAAEIGKLHRVLETIPFMRAIRKSNSSVVGHNRKKLGKIIEAAREHGEQTDFDSYAISILDEIDERSRAIIEAKIVDLPFQIIHYDLHPHNVLFDGSSKELLALLDFDPLRYSQRARDVGFGMHRFARTCGSETERKNDVGVDVRMRGRRFLDSYVTENELSDKEIKSLPLLIQDEAMRRVMNVLANHYLRNDTTWSFDLQKQVTTLREGSFFSF
jgi:Ser/Thr protein kinase RdoA (MazF antagonist)